MYQSSSTVQPNNHPPPVQNGHPSHHHNANAHHQLSHRPQPTHQAPKEPIRVLATPSIEILGDDLLYGDALSSSERAYTPIKVVGDGSFGTVWLVDWHSVLPPNTPLSPMQCGAGARPEWAGKRLVALKRMKKRWEGGWDECRKLKELESLRAIPFHPNIIPLYDFFLLPTTKELYFVFEPMEGNLYQLIKSRKGRALAGGLVSCIFRQVVSGLHHIHEHGYFHRDMKPENLLVTTTGLYDYRNVSPFALPGAPPEKDVVVIVKLADFGLARETKSKPPYTEYVSTRWYRAPEVLLRSRDYSNPVDMWALGTIMAELINLKPLFPGQTELDQIARICEVLGDPSDEYGVDKRGVANGGGKWVKGIRMARSVRYEFPKLQPKSIHAFFDRNVPLSMIECISDLLKYDPDMRLTSKQCMEHPYIVETSSGNTPPGPSSTAPSFATPTKPMAIRLTTSASTNSSMNAISPRSVPPSHSNSPANIRPSFNGVHPPIPQPQPQHPHRIPFYPQGTESLVPPSQSPVPVARHVASSPEMMDSLPVQNDGSYSSHNTTQVTHNTLASSVYAQGGDRISNGAWSDGSTHVHHDWEPMDVSSSPPPPERKMSQSPGQQMDITYTQLPHEELLQKQQPQAPSSLVISEQNGGPSVSHNVASGSGIRFFGKKRSKWHIGGMFGHGDKNQQTVLPPVDELNATSPSTPSLKRTQSSSTDSRSLSELSPITGADRDRVNANEQQQQPNVPMDEKTKKKQADKIALEAELVRRAQAEKRAREASRIVMQKRNQVLKQNRLADIEWEMSNTSTVLGVNRPKPKPRATVTQATSSSATVNAAGGSFRGPSATERNGGNEFDKWREAEHRTKARRRDFDDDHSMSSSEVQSLGRVSMISFATVDSDPSSTRLQHRPSMFGIKPISRMQSTSSLRTSFGDDYSLSARSSNSPSFETQLAHDFDRTSFSSFEHARSSMSETSASSPPPLNSLSLSSPQQQQMQIPGRQPYILPLPIPSLQVSTPTSSYEYGPYGQIQAQPPSPAIAPHSGSAINPMFRVMKVPPLTSHHDESHLPSFSQLAAVAEPLPALHSTTEDS